MKQRKEEKEGEKKGKCMTQGNKEEIDEEKRRNQENKMKKKMKIYQNKRKINKAKKNER